MRETILDVTERRVRLAGYNGFSFRDVAADAGIKSSSVHYHFPGKELLVDAIAERYTERAREWLGDQAEGSADAAVERVAALFLKANETDDLMCLCGLLGAESGGLPPVLRPRVSAFFTLLIDWLDTALTESGTRLTAREVVAQLEGGLMMSRTLEDPALLRDLVARLSERAKD
ncbi:TetR family transcriptional regulator [Novosphingobium sp. TCA1]|jgi:TetR/AcrR family transcriptional repressor of nem operon|nr:hypothetical protein LTR94_017507 [Friedmanniomyces endolithicus]GFE77222.1 TetR family transcriptional regulator [Novosphingobium sp. TCA1]